VAADSDEEEIELILVRVFVHRLAGSFPETVIINVKDALGRQTGIEINQFVAC